MKVVADKHIPFLKGLLEPYCRVEYYEPQNITNEKIRDADALIIRTRTRCDKTLLENTKVRFIATATIGYDHIDTQYCSENGIHWTNAPGCNAGSVMQYVAATLVSLQKKYGFHFSEKKIGIIGYGNVGKKVAHFAATIGMPILINDPPLQRTLGLKHLVELDELLQTVDIITLHVPLNKEGKDKTYHLFDESLFSRIRHGTILINTARGEVIDTKALIKAIEKGIISDVVLDVWENEPLIEKKLLNKVYIGTPHIAGYSIDGKANATLMSVEALKKFFHIPLSEIHLKLPLPEEEKILLDNTQLTFEEMIFNSIIHTYDIRKDFEALLSQPSTFEKLRTYYPVRREFHAYTIQLTENNSSLKTIFLKMGFNVM